jgi:disulfide bond formation protein DsbB
MAVNSNEPCVFCIKIRLFLIAVIFIVIISLIFGKEINFAKFINSTIIGNLIFLAIIITFSVKYYFYKKNKD